MRSVVKIAFELTEEQAAILDSQSKIANWLYNHLLEHANALRKQYRETQDKEVGKILYTERGLRNLVPALKVQHPFLKVVYSSVLKNAALRLSKAIRDYQDGKHGRRANVVSWPTFRAWKRKWFSLQYDEAWKGYTLHGRTLTLVLGQDATGKQLSIVLELSEALPHWVKHEHIRQCRIVKEGHRYSAVFSVQRHHFLPTKWWRWTPTTKTSPMRWAPMARPPRSTIPISSRPLTSASISSNPSGTSAGGNPGSSPVQMAPSAGCRAIAG
jgi:putative transposase